MFNLDTSTLAEDAPLDLSVASLQSSEMIDVYV